MLFLGKVISTKDFGTTGTIEVLLPQKYYANGLEGELAKKIWEIGAGSEEDNNSETLAGFLVPKGSISKSQKLTVSCNIVTPVGNGYNTGLFQLPQVNTVGLVLQTQDYMTWSNTNYIWIGGVYGCKLYGEPVIIPRDDTETEELESVDTDIPLISKDSREAENNEEEDTYYGAMRDDISGNTGYFNEGQILLKTKSTLSSPGVRDGIVLQDGVDLKQIPVENTISINKNKIALRHDTNNKVGKTAIADVFLENDKIKIKRIVGDASDDENAKPEAVANEQLIEITSNDITISFNNIKDEANNKIVLKSDGSIEIASSSDIKVSSDGRMDFNSKKEMSLVSDGKMSFVANNQNLKKILDSLINDVEQLKTQGSPALQWVTPDTELKFEQEKAKLGTGYE